MRRHRPSRGLPWILRRAVSSGTLSGFVTLNEVLFSLLMFGVTLAVGGGIVGLALLVERLK